MAPHNLVLLGDRRLAAVGRLVRLQRRLGRRRQRPRRRRHARTPRSRPPPRPWPGCSPNGSSSRSRRVLGIISGAVAGLVAITPASGFVNPTGALVIGIVAGVLCYLAAAHLKKALGYDDSLDAFGVHGIGGIVGALLTGVFADPAINPAGLHHSIIDPVLRRRRHHRLDRHRLVHHPHGGQGPGRAAAERTRGRRRPRPHPARRTRRRLIFRLLSRPPQSGSSPVYGGGGPPNGGGGGGGWHRLPGRPLHHAAQVPLAPLRGGGPDCPRRCRGRAACGFTRSRTAPTPMVSLGLTTPS